MLVDGYNIIFAWDKLKAIAEDNLEDARVKFLQILSDYQGSTGLEVVVVFDAHKVKGSIGKVESYGKLKIVYTKEAETADNYIERASFNLAKTNIVEVATSDCLEQLIILSKGAYRISARELAIRVDATKKQLREKYIENKPCKNNLLINNVDKKTAELLERMRTGKIWNKKMGWLLCANI